MAELARGTIADRPWGRTLGTLGSRGLTGQLQLGAAGKRFQIAFTDGAVVGATSPMASDAAVRLALTAGLLSSTQVAEVARRQAAAPHRDEIEVISELVRLAPDQALRLRRRAIAQRAARTFSIDKGVFVVDDQITVPLVPGSELDVRSVIYLGARQNLSEDRLDLELATFGSWFRLRADAVEDLPQFGFGTESIEADVLEWLQAGAALADLDKLGEVRTVRAMVYALASCGACELQAPQTKPKRGSIPTPTHGIANGSSRVAVPRSQTPGRRQEPSDAPRRKPESDQAPTRRSAPSIDTGTNVPRRQASSRPPVARRVKAGSAHATDVTALITQRLQLLSTGADHFQLLGIDRNARPDEIRTAYFALARQLHPDRLSALGIADESKEAQRLFAQVNTAFSVLSDTKRRQDYTSILRRGGEAAVRAEQIRADQLAMRILDAEEAFRRGEMALRRDQLATAVTEFRRAIELNPDEADYHALHAWAQFCASTDKMAVASATRIALDEAIARSPRAIPPRFYLGRVERMLGRDHDALRHFQEVLRLSPHHADASAEARVIELRLGAAGDKPGRSRKR
jgi:tetratricopeptide (TPR) repeat protein